MIIAQEDPWYNQLTVLWTSDPFPTNLVSRFVGIKGANVDHLNMLLPGLLVSVQPFPENLAFHLFKILLRKGAAVIEVQDSLTRAIKIINSIMSAVFVKFPQDIRHILCVANSSQALSWLRVSKCLANLAANLDGIPPIVTPVYSSDIPKYAMGTLDECDQIIEAFCLDKLKSTDVSTMHNQSMVVSTVPLYKQWPVVAAAFISKLIKIRNFYAKHDCQLRIKAIIGMHCYTETNIKGPLKLKLPPKGHLVGDAFNSSDLPESLDRNEVKASLFTTLHPLTLRPIVRLMPAIGCQIKDKDLEKITVFFLMSRDHQSPIPMGYTPLYQFRATFILDKDAGQYNLSQKGLHIRSADINKSTLVDLSRPYKSVPIAYRLVQTMKQLVRPSDVYESSQAHKIVELMGKYFNDNMNELCHPAPVGDSISDRRMHALTPMPDEFNTMLSQLTIRHRRRVKFCLGKVDLTVSHQTFYYRRDRFDEDIGTVIDRMDGCPIPHPTSVFLRLKHMHYGYNIGEDKDTNEIYKLSQPQIIELCRVADKVCQHVQGFVDAAAHSSSAEVLDS